jgi:N-acetylneuraminic acid mutarotase
VKTVIFVLIVCSAIIGLLLILSIISYKTYTDQYVLGQLGWTTGSSMPTPRTEFDAALLNDEIYIIGGHTEHKVTDIVEVYSPTLDKWANNVQQLHVELDHSAVAAHNGKLYLLGGFVEEPEIPQNLLLIYDPLTNKWQEGASMPTPRGGLTAQFVNGILYAIGGSHTDKGDQLSVNEAYDPVTNRWTEKAPMPTSRHHLTSAVVDGKIYVIGGRQTTLLTNLNTNEMYDPEKDRWVKLEPMPTKRSGMAAASIDDRIYVFGGEKEKGGSFDKNEKYNVRTNEWTQEAPMPIGRIGLEAVAYIDKIYVIGGKLNTPYSTVTGVNEIFHIQKS